MLLFIRYSNVSPADLITTLLLNPELKKYFLFSSSPSQFYQMQSEVANRSVQCNKFGAQSYKLWYKWHIDELFIFNHHDRYITSKYCSHRKEWYKQDMTQWRNVWNASPQEKGGWRVKKKFWSQCTQVIILSYKSYRIPKRYCYISSNIV